MRDSDQGSPLMMPAGVRENVMVTKTKQTFEPVFTVHHTLAILNRELRGC